MSAGVSLGALPPSSAISWVPTFTDSTLSTSVNTSLGILPVTSAAVIPSAASVSASASTPVSATPSCAGAGLYLGEGLLLVPDKLAQKIIRLEFVEMRDLMPETWLREEDEVRRNTLSWPRRRTAPITDILQWLQCYAAMVGVLARAYPQMVPEFMSYQATIIKCARDFDGIAWAQYDRAYRRQVSQTKDLRWSRLNPTLYSLCFAGRAKRHIACSFCLSDNHASDHCPENPNGSVFPWFQSNAVQATTTASSVKPRFCHLYNAREGPRCTFQPCKFAHQCSVCRGLHPRSACQRASVGGSEATGLGGRSSGGYKRPRSD